MKSYSYYIQIKTQPVGEYQSYRGWDAIYLSEAKARNAKKRAEAAGFHAARVVASPVHCCDNHCYQHACDGRIRCDR